MSYWHSTIPSRRLFSYNIVIIAFSMVNTPADEEKLDYCLSRQIYSGYL